MSKWIRFVKVTRKSRVTFIPCPRWSSNKLSVLCNWKNIYMNWSDNLSRTVTISANRSHSNGLRRPINLRKAEGKKGAPKGHTLPFCENPDDVVFHRLASCGVFQRLSSGTWPITIPTKTSISRHIRFESRSFVRKRDAVRTTGWSRDDGIPFGKNQAEWDLRMTKVKQEVPRVFHTMDGEKVCSNLWN